MQRLDIGEIEKLVNEVSEWTLSEANIPDIPSYRGGSYTGNITGFPGVKVICKFRINNRIGHGSIEIPTEVQPGVTYDPNGNPRISIDALLSGSPITLFEVVPASYYREIELKVISENGVLAEARYHESFNHPVSIRRRYQDGDPKVFGIWSNIESRFQQQKEEKLEDQLQQLRRGLSSQ